MSRLEMVETAEDLEASIQALRKRLNKIKDAEHAQRSKDLVGKCFRYRNCYSCPKSDKDYWWLYLRVTGIGRDGMLKGFEFAIDSEGVYHAKEKPFLSNTLSGWSEISLASFESEWRKTLTRLTEFADSAISR